MFARAFARLAPHWPLIAAAVSALMLAVAHASETFGHLIPCELCLRQREVYWVALAVGLVGYAIVRGLRRPRLALLADGLLALVFLVGAGVAAYHAGVEWKWWRGPEVCTGGGSASAGDLAALLAGAKVAPPRCDVAAWRGLGLSMAGWNALASLGYAALSVVAARQGRRANVV